jgi:hypothetical protein
MKNGVDNKSDNAYFASIFAWFVIFSVFPISQMTAPRNKSEFVFHPAASERRPGPDPFGLRTPARLFHRMMNMQLGATSCSRLRILYHRTFGITGYGPSHSKLKRGREMRTLVTLLLWAILLALCWPLGLLLLLLWPVLWLLSIPFRIFGAVMEALLALVKAVLFLPARLLGYRDKKNDPS